MVSEERQTILVDSNVWIAEFSPDDNLRPKVRKVFKLITSEATLFTTNLIFYESLTVLSMRVDRQSAIKFGSWFFDRVRSGQIHLITIDTHLEQKTWELFQQVTQKDISFTEKDISFTDCATAAAAKHWGIDTILTFDRDFLVFKRQLGISIVGV